MCRVDDLPCIDVGLCNFICSFCNQCLTRKQDSCFSRPYKLKLGKSSTCKGVAQYDILDDKISIVPTLDLIRNKITGFCIGNLRCINRLFKNHACFLYDFCVNIIFICNFNVLRTLSCYKDCI